MPRPFRKRRVDNPPSFKGFKPIGMPSNGNAVVINYEEYEAIRLSDFELLSHEEASGLMDVSRPTYTRIYESARRKVAKAFVLGQPIVFEGGKVYFNSEWYMCHDCGCFFNHPDKEVDVSHCALCGSNKLEQVKDDAGTSTQGDICKCPACGHEIRHQPGTPCLKEHCPKCSTLMVRQGPPHRRRGRG